MSNLKIEFTDKEITAWGGIAILQKMMEKMSFREVYDNNIVGEIRIFNPPLGQGNGMVMN